MPLTHDDMARSVALDTGYAGVDHDATAEVHAIIKKRITTAHAELTRKGAISHDIDAVPDAYETALVRYYANEAKRKLDNAYSVQEYQTERTLALKDVRRITSPPDPATVVVDEEALNIRYI